MPQPFYQLSLDDFANLLREFSFTRQIESIHLHHSWRPNHDDFANRPVLDTLNALYTYSTQVRGWADIPQHLTIDPRGILWTGRDWNLPPASVSGFNGNTGAGPFMITLIGDFNQGKDQLQDPQRSSAVGAVATLLRYLELPPQALRLRTQLSGKDEPALTIDREAFLQSVREVPAPKEPGQGSRAFPHAETVRSRRSADIIASWNAIPRAVDEPDPAAELPVQGLNANDVDIITGHASLLAASSRGVFGPGPKFTPEEKQILRPHVVNLRLGVFSDTGSFTTSLEDVEKIFGEDVPKELELRKSQGKPLHLLFYAHGGLVSEEEGIRPILRRLPFWRQNGIYPIFFCWETGLKESVQDLLQSIGTGQRGLISDAISDAKDAVLEAVAGIGGRQIWGQMKRVAELASLPGAGARTVATMAHEFWKAHQADIQIHALGHSAGSIFHSYFLPALLDTDPDLKVETLHYLAPACTTALFKDKLIDQIGADKRIKKHTMYTMNKDLEQADTAGPYNKSLLYFVSRAFETVQPTPILGLEESLRRDPTLVRFYGLSRTVPGLAQILFSETPANAPLDSSTRSHTHGDFDNEEFTMNSVARRILQQPTGPISGFVDETKRNEVTRALRQALNTIPASSRGTHASPPQSGARRALCIGIDAYPAPNTLAGCVNDAGQWAKLLGSLGFEVSTLVNEQATRAAMLEGMRNLINSSTAGDSIVIQYAGHGTQLKDLDGDEVDGTDEALVPVDFQTGAFLIDDDLRLLMARIPDGVAVTCFMDCCHSGTNTRLLGPTPDTDRDGSRPRFIKATPALNQAHADFRARVGPVTSAAPRSPQTMREINFAACMPEQVAFETSGSGDFTHRAVPIIQAGGADLTNAAFLSRVLAAFGTMPRQSPNLDCADSATSLPLFGVAQSRQPASGNDAMLSRLDAIEMRLAKLGV